jgi:hypothetical protein
MKYPFKILRMVVDVEENFKEGVSQFTSLKRRPQFSSPETTKHGSKMETTVSKIILFI